MLNNVLYPRIVEFCTLENECAYLPDKKSRMEYKYIQNASGTLNDALTQRGWRRFGQYYSRPNCKGCQECKNLRIDALNYKFGRNARRTIKKNKNLIYTVGSPTLTNDHLKLYEKYHEFMERKKGWKKYSIKASSYHELYVAGAGRFGKEILYYLDDKLIAVDLVDFLDNGISAIYFFYDPDFAHLSLGRYSIYVQIDLAKKFNLRWIYLGYYVKECSSLNYKANYKPYQLLQNNPKLQEKDIWN